MSEHKILDAVTGGLIGVLHLNEDGQTITSPITGKLNYYITPPIPFGGSSDLSEYAKLSGGNTFSGDQILGGGLNAAGKIMQGYGPGSTQWSDAPDNSVSLGSAYATGSYAVAAGKGSIARGKASMAVGVTCTVNAAGEGAFCVGNYCSTNRPYSFVAGNYCAAYDTAQLVTGQYNALVSGARVTGNGSGNNARRNIEVLDWDGNLTIAGDLTFTPTGGSATTLAALIARIEALEQSMN